MKVEPEQVLNEWVVVHERWPSTKSKEAVEKRLGQWVCTQGSGKSVGGQKIVFDNILTPENRRIIAEHVGGWIGRIGRIIGQVHTDADNQMFIFPLQTGQAS